MTDLITILSNFGFPVFAFICCALALKYAFDKSLVQQDKSFEQLAELTKAVNNNTIVLTELVEKLEGRN